MLTAYRVRNQILERQLVKEPGELTRDVRWVDLANPSEAERQWVKEAYGQELLFIEELGEIEASARFYRDDHGLHLHLYFLQDTGSGQHRNVNVGFTFNRTRLFTLHAEDVTAIRTYVGYANSHPGLPDDAASIAIGINQCRIGNLADVFERLHSDLETLSATIFAGVDRSMTRVLESLGRIEDTNGKARLGMIENRRVITGLLPTVPAGPLQEQMNDLLRDVDSLMTHSNYLFEKAKFLMDSALGMIDIQHARRLSIFTVLSVVLMPPTLIASIYGMNFEHMPELKWLFGYPMALLLMLAVAVGPILYLKHKDWL